MRIAFVTSEFVTEPSYDGGLANYVARVGRALVERGHDVDVFVRSTTDEVLDHHGMTVHRVVPRWEARMRVDRIDRLCPRSLYMPYQDVKAAWALWRCWKRVQRQRAFEMVQLSNVTSVGLFFRRHKEVPMCTRLSSYFPVWQRLGGRHTGPSARMRRWMQRRALSRARFAYAPTRVVADQVRDHYGVGAMQVIATPYFQETEIPEGEPEGDLPSGPFTLFFGRKNRAKGIDVLRAAAPGFLEACPDWSLVCIGKGNGDGAGMDRWVDLDAMPHERLYQWVREAAFVVLPSVADNLPNAALESMGLGTPVLTTVEAGLGDLVKDGEAGWVVAAGGSEALETRLIEVAQLSPEERARQGEVARERVASLRPERSIPRLMEYFESVRERW